jgi:hypothetical protein
VAAGTVALPLAPHLLLLPPKARWISWRAAPHPSPAGGAWRSAPSPHLPAPYLLVLPPKVRRTSSTAAATSSSTRWRVPPLHGGSGDGGLRRWREEPCHLARVATPGSARAATPGSASPARWWPAPARWWLAGGGPCHGPAMCCIFLFFVFCLPCVLGHGARQSEMIVVRFRPGRTAKCRDCRAFFYRRTAKAVTCHLVWAPSVAFLCRAPPHNARQRLLTVRCQTRRTAKGLDRAKCYRVPFAVRPDEKRTAKSLLCVLGLLP